MIQNKIDELPNKKEGILTDDIFRNHIFEYGLKKKKPKEFLDFIKTNNIKVIVDIRNSRGDRYKNWWGSGNAFEKLVRDHHFDYFWFKNLGIPFKIRYNYREDPEGMRKAYQENLKKNQNALDFKMVYELAKDNIICLICVEDLSNPKTPYCHRIWCQQKLIEYHKEMQNE